MKLLFILPALFLLVTSCKPVIINTDVVSKNNNFVKGSDSFFYEDLIVRFNTTFYYGGKSHGDFLCGVHCTFFNNSASIIEIDSRCIEIKDNIYNLKYKKTTAGINDSAHFEVLIDSTFLLMPGDKMNVINFYNGVLRVKSKYLNDTIRNNSILFKLKGIKYKTLNESLFEINYSTD